MHGKADANIGEKDTDLENISKKRTLKSTKDEENI